MACPRVETPVRLPPQRWASRRMKSEGESEGRNVDPPPLAPRHPLPRNALARRTLRAVHHRTESISRPPIARCDQAARWQGSRHTDCGPVLRTRCGVIDDFVVARRSPERSVRPWMVGKPSWPVGCAGSDVHEGHRSSRQVCLQGPNGHRVRRPTWCHRPLVSTPPQGELKRLYWRST